MGEFCQILEGGGWGGGGWWGGGVCKVPSRKFQASFYGMAGYDSFSYSFYGMAGYDSFSYSLVIS